MYLNLYVDIYYINLYIGMYAEHLRVVKSKDASIGIETKIERGHVMK